MSSVTSTNRVDYFEIVAQRYLEERYQEAYAAGNYQEVQNLAAQVLGLNRSTPQEAYFRALLSTSQTKIAEKIMEKPLEYKVERSAPQSD